MLYFLHFYWLFQSFFFFLDKTVRKDSDDKNGSTSPTSDDSGTHDSGTND